MKKQMIDLTTWNRTHLFQSYLGTDYPYINATCNIDVAPLYKYCKEEGISFYFAMIYITVKMSNEIENFRYRFEGDTPYLVEENVAFATHLEKGFDVFQMVECKNYPTIKEAAQKNRENASIKLKESGLYQLEGRSDFLHISSIPWIHYSAFDRTIAKIGETNIPKVTYGKFKKEDDKIWMPFSVLTHHGLMDGYHVGLFVNKIEEYIGNNFSR
ncbi:CatA-like O-acetyltransferase [Eubacterium oxidoreducens]|uniref:Chloramphenicol O-acetyltransferase type A n=1 Tax=Eubacterium oxidoreducens TaxID=1732 RepID=A0A1G6AGR5_EUBOX|nr:CatA-like O-acetyltransferase [Eubacterium oxidoreducens]SDB07486.1 chloramphenicol O-acetyltransferase type A [Eubacterium oxidoreducens]